MNETTKYEFCSEEWVAIARTYLVDAVGDADLGDASFGFCEEFTDPPAHLLEPGESTTGWYVSLVRGELHVEKGLLPDADIRITADYATVLPLAQIAFEDNPEAAADAQKTVEAATADGKMRREGDLTAVAKIPALAGAFAKLHDTLARRTL